MNFQMIRYILGWVMNIEAAFMAVPCITALVYQERSGYAFLLVMLCSALAGFLLTRKKPHNTVIYAREGFVTVALSWIVMSFIGAMPFVISGEIPRFVDALFESVSGFTTTGASILADVEALSRCTLIWRSFTHWIGGMGVLVFLLAVLPLAGGYYMYLMKAESPGPSVSKLVPKVKRTAMILYGIYIGLTILQIILMLLGDMPFFDALATAFGTAGTGGFGIKNDSIGGYSAYIQNVITIFMILFGVNFNVYYLILAGKARQAVKSQEVRGYFLIILAAVTVITLSVTDMYSSLWESMRHAAFQVGSIITTTGFSTTNFDLWPQNCKTILIILMFVGACAGSTGGGIKVSRLVILLKTVKKELAHFIHPRSIKKIKMDGHPIEHEVVRSVNVFLITYAVIFFGSVLLITVDNLSFTTNFTAVAATLNNIGPGLEMVGPTQNFGLFSDFSKVVLMFDMLAGRLELFPMLLLLTPATWRR